MDTHTELESILDRAEVPNIYWPGLVDSLVAWRRRWNAEPVWCEHIEWNQVREDESWWFLVPFNDIRPVGASWMHCPVCGAPRPSSR